MTLTIRSADELAVIHTLIGRYLDEVHTIEQIARDADEGDTTFDALLECKIPGQPTTYLLTVGELRDVYERRRDALANELQNKGLPVKVESPTAPAALPYPYERPS